MPRRRHLYPSGLPEKNVLSGLLTDEEWGVVRLYLNNPRATMANVASENNMSSKQLGSIVAIVNVEYARNPTLLGIKGHNHDD